jgi:hypothetical protein
MSNILISGDTGAGKTEFCVNNILLKKWKKGYSILSNSPLKFPNNNERVEDFRKIHELYLKKGTKEKPLVVFVDEAQKLVPKGGMGDFPSIFLDKLTQGRKHYIDFVTTTQQMANVHVDLRRLLHDWYNIETIFKFPKTEWSYPIIQINRITLYQKVKTPDPFEVKWEKKKIKFRFISRYFTKELFDTYKDIGMEKYLCKLMLDKNKWTAKFYDRSLVERGRARL